MTQQSWLKYKRFWEPGFWIMFFAVQATANSIVSNIDISRNGLVFAAWEPWTWEISSNGVLLLLIPLILMVDHRYPLQGHNLRKHLLIHILFTLPFSLLHVGGMVAVRELVYQLQDASYDFGNWPLELFYEYLKDVRAYATFLALIYLYRFLLRRWQGEAQFLAQGREESMPEPVTDRFLVKKLGREFLVKVQDIDWIEAAGNYVTLHVGERLYPLRQTMANIEASLRDQGFARVHRSAIVNLDRIREIEPMENGDARAYLTSGAEVPVSRRYRQALKDKL